MSLADFTTEELLAEVGRRGGARCPTCRKWMTYMGRYDSDGFTLRCHGCLRATGACLCR